MQSQGRQVVVDLGVVLGVVVAGVPFIAVLVAELGAVAVVEALMEVEVEGRGRGPTGMRPTGTPGGPGTTPAPPPAATAAAFAPEEGIEEFVVELFP